MASIGENFQGDKIIDEKIEKYLIREKPETLNACYAYIESIMVDLSMELYKKPENFNKQSILKDLKNIEYYIKK